MKINLIRTMWEEGAKSKGHISGIKRQGLVSTLEETEVESEAAKCIFSITHGRQGPRSVLRLSKWWVRVLQQAGICENDKTLCGDKRAGKEGKKTNRRKLHGRSPEM